MARRERRARRPAAEWAVRGLLAATAAGIGWISVAHTLGYAMRTTDPARAHALASTDGRVAAQFAQRLAGAETSPANRSRADRLAREALRRDPTVVAAASTLGISAQISGHTLGARRLFAYAERLSRRDLQTQLWAIEDAVARGDVVGALRHYDVALRTSRAAPGLLFPILAQAVAEPSVRAALSRTLAAKPAWSAPFLLYAASSSSDPQATIDLFLQLRSAGVPASEEAGAALIGRLVSSNLFDLAWSYYATVRPGTDRRRSRDPRFTADLATPTAFDWAPVNDGGVSASVQRRDGGGLVDFSAPATVGGPSLRQVQLLPPGDYRIEGHSAGINQPAGASPYWTLTCLDGRELGRVPVSNSAQVGGGFAGRFTVPPSCSVQTLTLVLRPSDALGGVSGQIDRVQLLPAR